MAVLGLICWLLSATLTHALLNLPPVNSTTSSIAPEVIYQFDLLMPPENAILRSNGQLLVTCLLCPTLSQLDPELGPDQERRTVINFPDGVINVLGIDQLSEDIFAVVVGEVNLATGELLGPSGAWILDLREYQAPDYDNALVRATPVKSESLGGLFDGLAVINADKGLLAATDFVEGIIWLIDTSSNTTSVLATDPLFVGGNGSTLGLGSTSLANGLKFKDDKLFFTASATGTYGYIPVDPSTGEATGPVTAIYNYGFSLDDFAFGPTTGDTYFTTFADPDGGIIRRKADTPDGESGSEMILEYFATNSVIARQVNDTVCELICTVFLQFQVVKFYIPGPC